MDMSDSKELLSQVRTAHRLLASYYNRVHQLIRDVSSHGDLGLAYLSWGPTAFSRTPQRSTKILDRWPWDLLPGVATEYVFVKSASSTSISLGDWLLVLHVVNDDGVFGEGKTSEALDLKTPVQDAHSVLRCYLIASHKNREANWYHDNWSKIEWPEFTETPQRQSMEEVGEIYASAFEIPLEELTGTDNAEILVQKIIAYRDVILPSDDTKA